MSIVHRQWDVSHSAMPAWMIRIVGGGGVVADRVTTVRGRDLGLDCRTRIAAVFPDEQIARIFFLC